MTDDTDAGKILARTTLTRMLTLTQTHRHTQPQPQTKREREREVLTLPETQTQTPNTDKSAVPKNDTDMGTQTRTEHRLAICRTPLHQPRDAQQREPQRRCPTGAP